MKDDYNPVKHGHGDGIEGGGLCLEGCGERIEVAKGSTEKTIETAEEGF